MPAIVPARLMRVRIMRRGERGHVGRVLRQRLLLEKRVLQGLSRRDSLVRVKCQQLVQERQSRHRHIWEFLHVGKVTHIQSISIRSAVTGAGTLLRHKLCSPSPHNYMAYRGTLSWQHGAASRSPTYQHIDHSTSTLPSFMSRLVDLCSCQQLAHRPDALIGSAEQVCHELQGLQLALRWEQGLIAQKLCKYATHRPHVHCLGISFLAQQNLRCPAGLQLKVGF